ncbi:hypothetical protein ACE1OC_17135 [Streptomyces sp. DSM 116496]|uniref:YybH family protein n=1 Tax=Streptomyces stoeckheimensis TaxID=3344656 RepID=UPI0038B2ACE7
MSIIKHTLPLSAAAIVLTVASIAGPSYLQTQSAAASTSAVAETPAAETPTAAETPAAPEAQTPTEAPTDAASQTDIFNPRPVARTPEQLLQLLGERIKAKDIEGIIALHEPEAAIVDWDLSVIRGHEAIRNFYVGWFNLNPELTVNARQTVATGGWRGWDGVVRQRTASIMGDYSLAQDGTAGGPRVSFTGNFCDTVEEQLDGTWLYVLDNPYPPHGGGTPAAASHH